MKSYSVRILRLVYEGESDLARPEPLTRFGFATTFRRDDVEINVEFHDYLIFGIYPRHGFRWTPAQRPILDLYRIWRDQPIAPPYHPAHVDNICPAPPAILDAQKAELQQLASTFDVLCWEHFRHCYPAVAQHIGQWFRHTVSVFSDDCPVCTTLKTDPVAKFFDSALHGNIVFDRETGLSTADHYHAQGVHDTHYIAPGGSGGLVEGFASSGFSFEAKLDNLRAGRRAPIDLVFVGPRLGPVRAQLAEAIGDFRSAGLDVRFHGEGMPDGVIPSIGEHNAPLPRATPLASLYAQSFAGCIPPAYGLLGTRMWDYWEAGVLAFLHDSGGEMRLLGAEAGTHYVAFDGTPAALRSSLLDMRERPVDAARIVEAGRRFGRELCAEYNTLRAVERILFSNLHKWRSA